MKTMKEKKSIEKYFESHDSKYLTEDTVFINMNNSELTIGREAVGKMLHFIYHVAFDAHAEITNTIVTDHKAVLEANFVGKHIGEFAGIPATGKIVKVPLCVTYDLEENGLIKVARVYMLESVMMAQLES
ncbi:MAG TPA: ester cyclase [Flavobacteriaceae bacterium]|jgi:predicted ester cyclase